MECSTVVGLVVLLLLGAILIVIFSRNHDNDDILSEDTMIGGGKKHKASKSSGSRKAGLINVHHNDNAKYIFIYFGDIYPSGLKESSMFKTLMNQTKYKKEAYAVYIRSPSDNWEDSLDLQTEYSLFETALDKEFSRELSNGAMVVLIGKGFASLYVKVFKAKLKGSNTPVKAIALNGMHLRELIPSMIMEKEGLSELNVDEIQFSGTKCIYRGKNYVKILSLDPLFYYMMYLCDKINTEDYYSFYGAIGDNKISVIPFNVIYDNTYIIRYGRDFRTINWLKRPQLLETALKLAL